MFVKECLFSFVYALKECLFTFLYALKSFLFYILVCYYYLIDKFIFIDVSIIYFAICLFNTYLQILYNHTHPLRHALFIH
jgi:hypothetical protein